MAIQIVADSSCDIYPEEAKELGITVLPLGVHFEGIGSYEDSVTIDIATFFKHMSASKTLPKTSQVNFEAYQQTFQKILDDGDEVICLTLSKKLSGCYQSATIAKDNLGDPDTIQLVDAGGVAFYNRAIVEKALELRDQGLTLIEMKEKLDKYVPQNRLWAVIEDLNYLKKGGRLSGVSAAVGGLLGIKPIIEIKNGLIEVVHKVRGTKNAYNWIFSQVRDALKKPAETLVYFAHGNCPEDFAEFQKQAIEALNLKNIKNCRIGTTVGTYTGPRVVAIGFLEV